MRRELTNTNSPCGLFYLKASLFALSIIYLWNFPGAHGEAGTPDPIPNSEVKRFIAYDTAYIYVGKQAGARGYLQTASVSIRVGGCPVFNLFLSCPHRKQVIHQEPLLP